MTSNMKKLQAKYSLELASFTGKSDPTLNRQEMKLKRSENKGVSQEISLIYMLSLLKFFPYNIIMESNLGFIASRCEQREIQRLPEVFLTKLLSDISSENPTPWLCGTRRSAGLPFFFKVIQFVICRS